MYQITKRQLIIVWVFGLYIMMSLFLFADAPINDNARIFLLIPFLLTPFALVFYTICWLNYLKMNLSKKQY